MTTDEKLDMILERTMSMDKQMIEFQAELEMVRESIEELCDAIEGMPEGLAQMLTQGVTFAREQLGAALAKVARMPQEELKAVQDAYAERLTEIGVLDGEEEEAPKATPRNCLICGGRGEIMSHDRKISVECPRCKLVSC